MRFAVVSVYLVGMIVTVMVFLADYTHWVHDQELAYEIASHEMRRLLADCGDDLVCDRPPPSACLHPNNVVEVHADLGPRRRFPLGVASAEASLYFDADTLGADVEAVDPCGP